LYKEERMNLLSSHLLSGRNSSANWYKTRRLFNWKGKYCVL